MNYEKVFQSLLDEYDALLKRNETERVDIRVAEELCNAHQNWFKRAKPLHYVASLRRVRPEAERLAQVIEESEALQPRFEAWRQTLADYRAGRGLTLEEAMARFLPHA